MEALLDFYSLSVVTFFVTVFGAFIGIMIACVINAVVQKTARKGIDISAVFVVCPVISAAIAVYYVVIA